MPIEDIEVILKKYNAEESALNKNLEQCNLKQTEDLNNYSDKFSSNVLTYEEAVARNKDIINEFDTVKGNLRSKAIFSPTELHWDQICMNYRSKPSLSVTTWRCHLPVFV